ncbi:hypothetical protein THRCLA_11127 [Thraustotheca clavata]|uniref:Transmembrane protein n=1 Tax=Thraustotheca clavata TaxID=74557 RepID=A0A1V9Y8R1_9STRA|nr:hypothetical protein THRCLA_11127 [Thraustotheca clavata]
MSNAILEQYDTPLALHRLWASYPRYIVFTELITPRDAIVGFRSFDAGYTFNLFTQYCWVDFDRRWEMAHTFKRQKRCYQRYQTNGAVYLEAIMRNVAWDIWNELDLTSEGQFWMASVPNAFKSIDSEVEYWTEKDILNYILQWNNCIQIGISESITIVNVFGSYQPLTTYHIAHTPQVSKWTTFGLYWGFLADLLTASTFNFSLVRSSTKYSGDDNVENNYVYPFTSASIVIHDILGPFRSIDTFFIAPPTDLADMVMTFDSDLLKSLQTNATHYSVFKDLTTTSWDAIPETWRQFDYQYFGGSPMCNIRPATTFVQSTFSFDDACGQPKPMQMTINAQSALFAYTNLRTSVILRQPLLQGKWSFFGYVGLYEWVYGHREVISFEGDVGIFVVLSEPLYSIPFVAEDRKMPNTTSQYLWAMAVATSVVLLAVAIAALAFHLRGNSKSSHHLFSYNRIAGPVWLGRPLMLLRSTTALVVLSTSPILFDSPRGMGRFHFKPRSVIYRLLLASEVSWLTEVVSDVLLIFTHDFARLQAPISSVIFWLAVNLFRVNMDNDLTCSSGEVNIGASSRAYLIVAFNFISVFIGSVIAKLYLRSHRQPCEMLKVNLLPASALAYCLPNGDIWSIEASIACMSGLIRFHYGMIQYVIDTKLWLLFTDNELSPIAINAKPTHFVNSNYIAFSVVQAHKRKRKIQLIMGLINLIGTVAGSLSYIQLADVNLSNDFWWANFNSTGTLTFIAN